MKYLPLQYCIEVPERISEEEKPEYIMKAFSNRDFGSYLYSFSEKEFSQLSKMILFNSIKPRKAELVMQPIMIRNILGFWEKTKQVYEPESEFSKILKETDNIKVYPALLKKLPFNDFYIDFENNSNFDIEGCFVSVRVYENDEIRIIYMVTDSKTKFKFVDIIDFTSEYNPRKELEEKVKLPEKERMILEADKTIIIHQGGILEDKRICDGSNYHFKENGASYYDFNKSMCPKNYQGHNGCYVEIDKIAPKEPISNIVLFIIQFLLYLSSKEPDIEESELTKQTYRPYTRIRNKFSEIRKWNVGLYYGKKIRLSEEKSKSKTQWKGTSHSRPRPHTRSAHWHSYWCGSGEKKHIELRWLDFTYVNGNEKDIIARDNSVGN